MQKDMKSRGTKHVRIALQKECGCRAPPRTASTGRRRKNNLASGFGKADFAFCYHIKTSPTASGEGLRPLALRVRFHVSWVGGMVVCGMGT